MQLRLGGALLLAVLAPAAAFNPHAVRSPCEN